MNIKVYGTLTSGHQMVMEVIKEYLSKAKIPYTLSGVNDVSEFLAEGVESIPAIQMDGESIVGLKSEESFNKSLRKAVNRILASENYGELSKFLVPVDFSDTSLNALSYGHRLATDMDAVTKVLHVYKPRPTLEMGHKIHALSEHECKDKLQEIVKAIDVDWGSDILSASLVASAFKVGFPVPTIIDTANESDADLILMGTTGTDDVLKKWFGSVSLDVIAEASSPVVLVPSEAKYSGINKILLAVNDTNFEDEKLDYLKEMCLKRGSELHVIHVNNDGIDSINQNNVKSHFPSINVKVEVVKGGEIVKILNKYAEDNDIDLIALSPRSKSLFSHFLQGSVTDKMSLYSSIPLLILR